MYEYRWFIGAWPTCVHTYAYIYIVVARIHTRIHTFQGTNFCGGFVELRALYAHTHDFPNRFAMTWVLLGPGEGQAMIASLWLDSSDIV